MSDLLDQVLDAHGGIQRWHAARSIRARLDVTGPTWAVVGQEKVLLGVDIEVDPHEQRTVFTGFTGAGRRGIHTLDHVAIVDEDGTVLSQRYAPRESYPPRDANTRWDPLHALYFGGYAMWNYLTTPYLLSWPGVHTEELAERRLRVVFPPYIATHSTEQTFSFDETGLLRRIDYAPYVLGSRSGAHHTQAHRTVSGLVFPTHRYVLPVVDGKLGTTPIITIDLADITVDFTEEAELVRASVRREEVR
jgi:hypothetical protein